MSTFIRSLPRIPSRVIPNKLKPPRLVNVYRSPKLNRKTTPSYADAPFGIQQQAVLDAIGDNAKDGKGFIYPLQKLVFNYCDFGGSSRGMREYITEKLVRFAKANPEFEIIVQPRPFKHPVLRGLYNNGFEKIVCLRKRSANDVQKFVELYKNTSGISPIKPKYPVLTRNESVRPMWSPFKEPILRPDRQPQPANFHE